MPMKPVRKTALLGAVAGAIALLSVPMAALAKTKVILSNDTQALSLKGKTFELFKKEIEKRLGDKVAVELHQSGALFDQKTQIQGLQLGGAHFISPTVGIYSSISPKVNALLQRRRRLTPRHGDDVGAEGLHRIDIDRRRLHADLQAVHALRRQDRLLPLVAYVARAVDPDRDRQDVLLLEIGQEGGAHHRIVHRRVHRLCFHQRSRRQRNYRHQQTACH